MSLNKKFLLLLVCSTAVAIFSSSALAQTSRVYFAGYLGLNTYNDQEFTETSTATKGDFEFKNGLSLAGALGLRLSRNFRLEGELSYHKADATFVDLSTGVSGEVGGELTQTFGLLNLYYDWDVPWKVQPFIGAGLGFALNDGEINDSGGLVPNASDESLSLIYQVGGGLRYRINPRTSFISAYRYVDGQDLEFNNYSIDYGSHEFRLGLEFDLPY